MGYLIKQESGLAKILRELLGIDGPVYPYHLFRFPIGGSWRVPGVSNLRSVEDIYRSKLPQKTEIFVTFGK
jgi:hypothetical protein